jgi:ABC-type iron transport system FetAB ATPase subunit
MGCKVEEIALTNKRAEKEKAIDDPTRAFKSPREVVESELSREEKIKVLKSWELDARRLLESAEENMAGGEKDRLPEVLKALRELEVGS